MKENTNKIFQSKPLQPDSKTPQPNSLRRMEPLQNLFPSKAEWLRLIAVLAIASLVAFACNFIATRLNTTTKTFCDTTMNTDSPHSLSDFCEPCPSNGECSEGKLECVRGYRKHGSVCVENGDIHERAEKLSVWVESRLCEAYAHFLCYGTGTVWVQEGDILNDLDRHQLMENYGSDNPIYMYTKKRAVETIRGLLNVRETSHGNKELKCPDLMAEHYKPFTCQIRQWISNNAFVIVPVCILVVGSTLLVRKVQRRQYLSTRGEELYRQVCDILEENALMSKEPNAECEPWMVASRLRDHLLLPKERKQSVLWKKVEDLVQEDSRIDQYPKLVKGESKVVWEWQVEGSLSSARMRKQVEANKFLKSGEGIKNISDHQGHEWKPEPETLMF